MDTLKKLETMYCRNSVIRGDEDLSHSEDENDDFHQEIKKIKRSKTYDNRGAMYKDL
jgi:hypothetical protein